MLGYSTLNNDFKHLGLLSWFLLVNGHPHEFWLFCLFAFFCVQVLNISVFLAVTHAYQSLQRKALEFDTIGYI